MTTQEQRSPATSIAAATEIGLVSLTVADLDRSLAFYTTALGFAVLPTSQSRSRSRPRPGALPWMVDARTGLYHFAILLPARADLGRWLRHFFALPYPPPGQGDHLVSEALYLRDPDGHGIEVYWDRPRATWTWRPGSTS